MPIQIKNLYNKSYQGFTIVELLIVIVVIGILAAIVIIAYTGVQNKAVNANLLGAFDANYKALIAYAQANSGYPQPTDITASADGNKWVCLEETANLPATSTFGAGVCAINAYGSVSTVVNTALKTIVNKLPSVANYVVSVPSAGFAVRGIFLAYYPSVTQPPQLLYYVPGNQGCGRGTANFLSASNVTQCFVALPPV